LDYEVSAIASTGEDAVESAEDESPDLVLMDIRLEGDMNGAEAAALIRSSLNIPIVFVTAHADEVSLERAKAGEPFGYLIKPYSEKELCSAVETALYKARAEKGLSKAKEEWERTFDAVPDLIMILDDRYRILRANRATADALGMTPEELIGQTCFERIHGQDAPVSTCPHSRVLADGTAHHSEVAEERLGGVFEVSVYPLHDAEGRLFGSVHVAHNITARKKTQDAL
jgi:PAS domain S-box-containing protein